MKTSMNQDTLAFQFGLRPGVHPKDRSALPLKGVVASCKKFFAEDYADIMVVGSPYQTPMVVGNPEEDAFLFYLMNHAVSIVRSTKHPLESLGDMAPLVDEYHNLLAYRGARMFYYLLLICTRESRHEKSSVDGTFWDSMAKHYGEAVREFFIGIRQHGGGESAYKYFLESYPNISLGAYTKYLVDSFYKGKYSSAFGGKAWGGIAKVLNDVVHGRISMEVMLDTSFTLEHNGGAIFNKGMLFEHSSSHLASLLDVQRSGQMPQFFLSGMSKWSTKSKNLKAAFELCKSCLGESFGAPGYVDWFLVEELGSKNKYPSAKAEQVSKYGVPPGVSSAVKATYSATPKVTPSSSGGGKVLEIMPGLNVPIIERGSK